MKKFILALLLPLILLAVFGISSADAALKASQKVRVSVYRLPYAVSATFANTKYAKKISYELSYQRAGGINDGAGGVITNPKGKTVTKSLTLGTCSGKVCTYHKGVKNIKLKVTVWYSPSLTVETKTYKLK